MTKREKLANELYDLCQSADDAWKSALTREQFVETTLKGFGCLRPATIAEMQNEMRVIRLSRGL